MCSSTGSLLQNYFIHVHNCSPPLLPADTNTSCHMGNLLFAGTCRTGWYISVQQQLLKGQKQTKKNPCRALFDIMSLFWTSIKAYGHTYMTTCKKVYLELLFISLCLVLYITIRLRGTHVPEVEMLWEWVGVRKKKNFSVSVCPLPSCENDETPAGC